MEALHQLQNLLRELFQLDLADLDFGLYRLLRLKRNEVEAFLSEQLPRRVAEAFQGLAGAERSSAQQEFGRVAERIREEIAEDALLPGGEVKEEYLRIKAKAAKNLIAEYESLRGKMDAEKVTDAQKAEVFNHLFAFFSRYYENGDFVPRRRYGAREAYAVAYNGEEALFHWANKGQHYVKTGESFKDYAFSVDTLQGASQVRFCLSDADLPPGNTKGDSRYFFPLPDQAKWEKKARAWVLPFHYRLPLEKEIERHGRNSRLQESILKEALPRILEAVPEHALRLALSETVEEKGDEAVSRLFKRLRHFCRRNTTDYFIHRDLGGFLQQELEFYLKDQVLHLADLEGDLDPKLRMLRVLRNLAGEIITFLAQMENAQRRLFEKKKFVLRTEYLIPIKEVPRELWKEVLRNREQQEAWKTLFALKPEEDLHNPKGEVNERFLEEHPTLVVHSAHFDQAFTHRLLAAFEDLDEAVQGILIHSENYQALRLLERKCAGRIKCIYIDPPYNTGSDGFIYKDRYRHSTWLAMMEERLRVARGLLSEDGAIFVSADDNEFANLRDLLDGVFGAENFIASIIWQKIFSPKSTARFFSEDHDYILAFVRNNERWIPRLLERTEAADARYRNPDNDPRGVWTSGDLTARNYYGEGQYEVTSVAGGKFRPAIGNYWRVSHAKFLELDRDNRIWWGQDGHNMPRLKRFLSEVKQGMVPQTLWLYSDVGHTQEAKQELISLVTFARTEDVLNTVKPTRLLQRILQIATSATDSDSVLDFFAGSGTTGHAVIRQNREDGGNRSFILVEMGDYFENIVLQRITRAIYAPEWKDGKPERLPNREEVERTPRLVKILRLEGYEDSLHNLATDATLEREAPRAAAFKGRLGEDAYRLNYLVRLPLEANASLLNLSGLEHPFSYRIEVLTDQGPKSETVDLVETFNLLYGLHVERQEEWANQKEKGEREYRVIKARDRQGKRILVLWRDMTDLEPAAERRFLEQKLKAEEPFDEMWINGDAAVPGIRSLDGLFKRLMEEGKT